MSFKSAARVSPEIDVGDGGAREANNNDNNNCLSRVSPEIDAGDGGAREATLSCIIRLSPPYRAGRK